MDKTAIRHAATIIVVRDPGSDPKILMGQRGAQAAFMPNKFVFPGGAVDPGDRDVALAGALPEPCCARLAQDADAPLVHALYSAAIRELWEETGLALSKKGPWSGTVPKDWEDFAGLGRCPNPEPLRFVFRAITPPGRPRRFDARFFLLDAAHLADDLDDFSRASDELSHLQWIPLPEVRSFSLPFITEIVLAEITARLPDLDAPDAVPFFDNSAEESIFRRIA